MTNTRTKFSHVCNYVGRYKKGEKVHIEIKEDRDFGAPWIVYYNEETCNQILDTIADKGGLRVEKHNGGKIRGRINVLNDNMFIMFTLPYLQGYRILIDGRKVGYKHYRNALLLVDVSKGEHIIEVSYCPPGLVGGLCVALITLLIYFSFTLTISKKKV